jgi:S-adenosyl methyltransferase
MGAHRRPCRIGPFGSRFTKDLDFAIAVANDSEAVIEANPSVPAGVRANRAFLRRAVRYLAGEAGIRQFLDIGSGLPTNENTHEAAQQVAPESRTVYVDSDPIVQAHGRALLDSTPQGVTAPHRIVARLLEAAAPGSYLVISDATTAIDAERAAEGAARLNARLGPARSTLRSRDEIARNFDGLDLIRPGLVPCRSGPIGRPAVASVGRKPG